MPADAKEKQPPEIDNRYYPLHTKALMVLVGSLSIILFWGSIYLTAKLASWSLSLFGSFRPHVMAVLAVYLAVSFIRAWRPVRPLPYVPPVKQTNSNVITPAKASSIHTDMQERGSDNVGSSHA